MEELITVEEKRQYFGCLVHQRIDERTVPFFVFYAAVRDVTAWAGIRRSRDTREGTQRILRPSRQHAMTRFVQSDPINTVPGNIILAFEPGTTKFQSLNLAIHECLPEVELTNGCSSRIEWGILEFSFVPGIPEDARPAFVVDGQHRLYGVADFSAENLPMLIVALVDASRSEQAFQFIVINDKAVRVATDNVKSIIAGFNENELQMRLLAAGVRYGEMSPILRDLNDLPSSPFRHLLDWDYNESGMRLVSLTSLEQALRYVNVQFPFLDDDEDSVFELFCAIWRAVSVIYSELWAKDNGFMSKVNINALNEFIVDRLKFAWDLSITDIFEPEDVERQVSTILKMIPAIYWETPWSIKLQDNANFRRLIKDDLKTLADNSRLRQSWHEGLKLPIVDLTS